MISVISIDDHEMISLGLEQVFSETEDIRVCHFCKTKDEAAAFIGAKSPEELERTVAMVDIKLENGSGFDAADFLIRRGVDCLMYSSFSNAGFVVKTMEHKIKGFVSKNAGKSEILDAVLTVARGGTYIQKDLISGKSASCSWRSGKV